MRAKECGRWWMATLLMLGACSDDPAQPPVSERPDSLTPSLLQAAISEPILSGTSGLADASVSDGVVYVAFSAGELGSAQGVRLRNVTEGGAASNHVVVDGGLDPVAIGAQVGDTLEMIVTADAGPPVTLRAAVPRKRAPRVVRVDPPRGRTDVALNSRILVVFSEPIDRNTLTMGAITLSVGGQPVAGRFEMTDGPVVAVQFVAAAPLAPQSGYTINITQNIRDLAGDALEQALVSTFTTATAGASSNHAIARVTIATTGADIPASYIATLYGVSAQPAPANGVVVFTDVPLTVAFPGVSRFIVLSGLPAHCSMMSANPRALPNPLRAGETVDISFTVLCDPGGPAGVLTSQQIAFVRGNDIFAVNADGTDEVRLISGGRNEDPAWSPDGRRLAFASDRSGPWAVYIANADGSGQTRVSTSNGSYHHASRPAWSPDGSRIAYHASCDGNSCIHVTAPGDTAPPLRLGQPRGYNTDPAWSPDGRSIAFVSDWQAYDFVYDIYVTSVDGSNIVQLTNGFGFGSSLQYFMHPVFSPDGSKIALVYSTIINTSDMRYQVAVMNLDGSDLRALAFAGDIPWVQVQDPGGIAWSPDGRRIAYTRVDCDLTGGRPCTTLRSIRYVAVDGSAEGLLVPNAHSPTWRH